MIQNLFGQAKKNSILWFALSLFFFFLERAQAVPPPKGESLRRDGNYEVINLPLGARLNTVNEREKRAIFLVPKPSPLPTQSGFNRKARVKRTLASNVKVQSPISRDETSNLPSYYQGISRDEIKGSDHSVLVIKEEGMLLSALKPGDHVSALIEQALEVSSTVPTPIRAIAMSGPLKGAFFLGQASLDPELKRVLLSFNQVRLKDRSRDDVYSLKATGLSPKGSVGLHGRYSSDTGRFFLAELGTSLSAGFLDATVSRQQNQLGNYIEEPSLKNATLKGAVTALSKTTENLAESMKHAPEKTETDGFQEILVSIHSRPELIFD